MRKKEVYDKTKKKAYYEKNKELILKKCKTYYVKNKEAIKASVRAYRLKTLYFPSLTSEEALLEYEKMSNEQKGLCAICSNPEVKIDPQLKKLSVLAVDHCKKTLKIRGLLCFQCNTKLGWFEAYSDKIDTYLKKEGKLYE